VDQALVGGGATQNRITGQGSVPLDRVRCSLSTQRPQERRGCTPTRRSQRCARHRWARSVLWSGSHQGSEKVVVHGDGVCTVGRSSGKHVSLMGVLRPGTGKLQSGSAGLDLRKATCGPVPRSHKPYKVAGPRLSRRIYPPRANQMTSATATHGQNDDYERTSAPSSMQDPGLRRSRRAGCAALIWCCWDHGRS
jgi:hypothetical protein